MHLQTFFPHLGADEVLQRQRDILAAHIETTSLLYRHAKKSRDFITADKCERELLQDRETLRSYDSLLAMRQHGTPVRQDQCERNSGAQAGQPGSAYMSVEPGWNQTTPLKSNSPYSTSDVFGVNGSIHSKTT